MRRRIAAPLSVAIVGGLLVAASAVPAVAAIVDQPVVVQPDADISLTPVGTYESEAGLADESAAEIVAYYPAAKRLLVVNALDAIVEVLDASDPTALVKLFDLETTGVDDVNADTIPNGAVANSVAVRADGLGAVAVESDPKSDDGWVVFFDAGGDGSALGAVRVGAKPDMLTFTPDGGRVVVANEGEPEDDYSVDPEGTIAVIDVPDSVGLPAQSDVALLDFHDFEDSGSATLPSGIRIFGGCDDSSGTCVSVNPVSENLEPEYVAVSTDSTTAWVTLQEANGLAIVDLTGPEITDIVDLGTIDRAAVALDASDRDDPSENEDPYINIQTWPNLLSYRLPDGIASYEVDGATYLVTANEGDTRDWDGYSEEVRVKDLEDDGHGPLCADLDATVSEDWQLGRLNVTTESGFDEGNSCYSTLYTFGGRSLSILGADGAVIWDSGSDFEEITAEAMPEYFNSDHAEVAFDNRSDNKGPEPEGVTVSELEGRWYAFIGLERVSGIMMYDVTDPAAPVFVHYINNRDFSVTEFDETAGQDDFAAAALIYDPQAGDLGPEGLTVISSQASPTGEPMLAVANEVSGTTTLYAIAVPAAADLLPATGAEPGVLLAAGSMMLLGGLLWTAINARRRSVSSV